MGRTGKSLKAMNTIIQVCSSLSVSANVQKCKEERFRAGESVTSRLAAKTQHCSVTNYTRISFTKTPEKILSDISCFELYFLQINHDSRSSSTMAQKLEIKLLLGQKANSKKVQRKENQRFCFTSTASAQIECNFLGMLM